MKARDVMVSPVVTVNPGSSVKDAAGTFLKRRISAVPVIDESGKLVGIVSESDLIHRSEAGTERRRSWWLQAFVGTDILAAEYVKAHARKVADVMTRNVITALPDTPLHEIATLLEKHGIKRVPIMENGQLVGIVSRANLVQAVASARVERKMPESDSAIRDKIIAELKRQDWANTNLVNVTVSCGVADLWGLVSSNEQRKALRVVAETTPGVSAVNDNLTAQPIQVRSYD